MKHSILILVFALVASNAKAQNTLSLPRCQVVPQAGQQVSLEIDGEEKLCWHFGAGDSVPFFYPVRGADGAVLTRMGHPGAPNHDHHRSVWFGHHDVADVDFWSMAAPGEIRQKRWLRYHDSDNSGIMAVELGWYDGEATELLHQQLVAAVLPLESGEYALEIQSTFLPGKNRNETLLGKTNFGFFAVRVAKSMSAFFGGGQIRSSEGAVGEPAIFGQPARWVDYSGPVASGGARGVAVEGITYIDHPANPRYPSRWHVREDGWMTASFCFEDGWTVTSDEPLTLRYLLYIHRGECNPTKADALQREFSERGLFVVERSDKRHQQYEVRREEPSSP